MVLGVAEVAEKIVTLAEPRCNRKISVYSGIVLVPAGWRAAQHSASRSFQLSFRERPDSRLSIIYDRPMGHRFQATLALPNGANSIPLPKDSPKSGPIETLLITSQRVPMENSPNATGLCGSL